MARLWTGGAELTSAAQSWEAGLSGTALTASSILSRSGSYAWRANPAGTSGTLAATVFSSDVNTIAYFRIYLYIATAIASTQNIIRINNAANGITAQ